MAAGDKKLKREGRADQAVGKIKQKVEKVIDKVKDVYDFFMPSARRARRFGFRVPGAFAAVNAASPPVEVRA